MADCSQGVLQHRGAPSRPWAVASNCPLVRGTPAHGDRLPAFLAALLTGFAFGVGSSAAVERISATTSS